MSSLVIVESPAKSKTINKILGKTFSVKASIGHVKDLPKKKLGVDVKKNFEPTYVVIPGKDKIIKELKKAAKSADKIYLATDPDREGEAIAWHIADELNGKAKNIFRVTFNEITAKAVKEAIKNPQRIDMNKVDAQQARRILDRLVGYSLSPLLWRKVRRGLSAGRVQSVAVRLVVEREREIEAFKKEEYWSISANLEGGKPPKFWAKVSTIDAKYRVPGAKFLLPDETSASTLVNDLKNKIYILKKIEKKNRKRMPYPPFITSTLQQSAARALNFSAKKTMMFAQQLYEGVDLKGEGSVGLITYMRTDSLRVAPEAQTAARKFIEKEFGKDYLPDSSPVYKSKASAQDAHESIRPTYLDHKPEDIKHYLSKEQFALYKLIWNRFIASQMAPAQLEQTTLIIEAGNGTPTAELRASGTVVRFNGFLVLYEEAKEENEEGDEAILPSLEEGEKLKLHELQPKQHFTQPPPRYSEATLVKTLEEKGIGRPSTYANILSTIQDRKYVQKTEGKFMPTELGVVVNDLLVDKFSALMDIGFTASMEDKLDHIEEGKTKWVKVVKEFYKPFDASLTEAANSTERVKPQDIPTEEICEKCGKPMVIRWGRHGRFLACSGFPECKNAKPIEDKNGGEPAPAIDEKCPKCGAQMVMKAGRFGKFLACSKYPECKTTKAVTTGVKCPDDNGDIVERRSKRGKMFWSCSNYPNCKFASWYKPVPKKCPLCKAEFLYEKRAKDGTVTLTCHNKECGYKTETDSSAAKEQQE
ncbi:MAG: type I DNA topoisomerase [Nitrospiraceae bacterium]|nr:type I DNA topoisomerase [Nitrospiraceae bacterium]